MNRKLVILIGVLASTAVLSNQARASIVGSAYAHTRYFEILRDFNAQDREFYDPVVVGYWERWIQAYRTIDHNAHLARRFARHRCDLTNRWLSLTEELQHLGLTEAQVSKQSAAIYTLDIATFGGRAQLVRFLKSTWVRRRVGEHRIYERVPKGFRLDLGVEATIKADPLYLDDMRIGGHKQIHLRYGVYESVRDAKRDRRQLQHYLNGRIKIVRRAVTGHLVEAVWLEPLLGREFQKWDVTNG